MDKSKKILANKKKPGIYNKTDWANVVAIMNAANSTQPTEYMDEDGVINLYCDLDYENDPNQYCQIFNNTYDKGFNFKFNGNYNVIKNVRINYDTSPLTLTSKAFFGRMRLGSAYSIEISNIIFKNFTYDESTAADKNSIYHCACVVGGVLANYVSSFKLTNVAIYNYNVISGTYSVVGSGGPNGLLCGFSGVPTTIDSCFVYNSTWYDIRTNSNYKGGIIGQSSQATTISNCGVVNTTLGGAAYLGGIYGIISSGTIKNCYIVSDLHGVQTNCRYIGNGGTISNCHYCSNNTFTGSIVANGTAQTSTTMKTQNFCYNVLDLPNGTDYKYERDIYYIADGFPILIWMKNNYKKFLD